MSLPPLGGVVLYTQGEVRERPQDSFLVCGAEVVAHNRDGTVQLLVHGPEGPAWRAWVPQAPGRPGTRAAAGKWSQA